MVEAKTITAGIIGVLFLAGLGTTYVLTKEQLPNTYICTTNNVTGVFDSLSDTNKTAYWIINGTTKSSVCRNGYWIPLQTYCDYNQIDCKKYLDPKVGMQINESVVDENGIDILDANTTNIIVSESKPLKIDGKVYNITYIEKPEKIVTKCICDRTDKSSCKIAECLQ